jgi:hypothetical protein
MQIDRGTLPKYPESYSMVRHGVVGVSQRYGERSNPLG